MGMPESSEHLEELMYRVLGELIRKGTVIKIADDLYVGGQTITDLADNWESVLQKFHENNLCLSASNHDYPWLDLVFRCNPCKSP